MRAATREQALKHPNWSMGAEDHHRFRDHDEQGPRADRGASSVRGRAGQARRAGASAVDRPRHGRIPSTARWSRSSARTTCASRSPIAWPGRTGSRGRPRGSISPRSATLTLREARSGPLSGAGARPARAGDRRRGAHDPQRRQRGRGRRLPARPARLCRHRRPGGGDAGRGRAARMPSRSRKISRKRSALTIWQGRWRKTSCLKSPQRHPRKAGKPVFDPAGDRVGTKCDEFQCLG